MVKFKNYGLNKFRNTMASPRCECGGKEILQVNDVDIVMSLAQDFLTQLECNHSAVFIANHDGYFAVVKDWDIDEDDPEAAWNAGKLNGAKQGLEGFAVMKDEKFFEDDDGKRYPVDQFFSFIDHDYQLHGYGLIVETDKGYEIIEE